MSILRVLALPGTLNAPIRTQTANGPISRSWNTPLPSTSQFWRSASAFKASTYSWAARSSRIFPARSAHRSSTSGNARRARRKRFIPLRSSPDRSSRNCAGSTEARVNSSHHQSVKEPGRGLRIVAHAPDGVIEAVEWTGDSNWVIGVQWHPERMAPTDALAQALFRSLVSAAAARKTPA